MLAGQKNEKAPVGVPTSASSVFSVSAEACKSSNTAPVVTAARSCVSCHIFLSGLSQSFRMLSLCGGTLWWYLALVLSAILGG